MAEFKVLSWNLPGWTEKHHVNPFSGWTMSQSKFKSAIRVQVRSVIGWASRHRLYYLMSFSVSCSVSCVISLSSTQRIIPFSNIICTARLGFFGVTCYMYCVFCRLYLVCGQYFRSTPYHDLVWHVQSVLYTRTLLSCTMLCYTVLYYTIFFQWLDSPFGCPGLLISRFRDHTL